MKRLKQIDSQVSNSLSAICFALFLTSMTSFSAYGQEFSLEGRWTLEKCEIQKDSAGVKSKVDYQPTDGDIPRWCVFTELTFGKEKSCSIMLDENEITGEYNQTDDKLILDFIIMITEYNYSLRNNNILLLKRRHRFQELDTEYFVDIEMSYSIKTEQNEN